MLALTFDVFGGPEVLRYADVPDPEPAGGCAIVAVHAIGLNFADVYRRRGSYHLAGSPPYVLGYEGAGVIASIDETAAKPRGLSVGDRVAFADVPHANAELVQAPITHLVPVPADVSFAAAAAVLLQGLTAQYLTKDSHALARGELAIVHAAGGGVGLLLTQLARREGAKVLALASSAAKRAAALRAGATFAASYEDDWVALARAHSSRGLGADVVYDSIGATLDASLTAARVGGHVVFYGMAGGDPAPVDPRRLMDESKSLTGGDLWNVLTSEAERLRRSAELFDLVRTGGLDVAVAATLPLSRGADAHRMLEGRGTIGKILLVPDSIAAAR